MVGTKEIMCHIIFKTLRVCPFYDKLYLPQLFTVVYVYELSSLRRGLILSIVYDIIPLCEGSLKDNPNTLRVPRGYVPLLLFFAGIHIYLKKPFSRYRQRGKSGVYSITSHNSGGIKWGRML